MEDNLIRGWINFCGQLGQVGLRFTFGLLFVSYRLLEFKFRTEKAVPSLLVAVFYEGADALPGAIRLCNAQGRNHMRIALGRG